MSDTGGSAGKKIAEMSDKIEKMSGGPFFTFAKPYLDFIGKEKIFGLVYIIMAVLNLLLPLGIIFQAVRMGFFQAGGKFVVAFLLSWLVIVFACWIGFQLWWDRKKKLKSVSTSEFIATPIFSEIVETFGEWMGTLVGIIGAGVGLIASIILGDVAGMLFSAIGMDFLNMGVMVVIAAPVFGFFIIIISRFLAEQLRIFAALANNTKDIAENIKK